MILDPTAHDLWHRALALVRLDLARANGEEVMAVDSASNGTRPEGEDRDGPDQLGEVLNG